MPSQTHLFFVFSNSQPERAGEFGQWYEAHVQEIVRLPGFKSAQRFEYYPRPGIADPERRHLAVYEIEGDVAAVLAQLRPAVDAGKLERPDPSLVQPTQTLVFSAVGAKYQAVEPGPAAPLATENHAALPQCE